MPDYKATIYWHDGTSGTYSGFCGWSEAFRWARQNTPKDCRCEIHTDDPGHGELFAKLFGNLVPVERSQVAA